MTALVWLAAAWCVISFPAGVIIGMAVRVGNERSGRDD